MGLDHGHIPAVSSDAYRWNCLSTCWRLYLQIWSSWRSHL